MTWPFRAYDRAITSSNHPATGDGSAYSAEITARLSPEKLARAFDYNRQLANVDAIFSRVLNTSKRVA